MQIVTLISDLGNKDWYAGALKGALLKATGGAAQLVDISHSIEPFEIVQAALVSRNSWLEYPEGTIQLRAVNCVYDQEPRFIAVKRAGHYFLAPDNGLLSLILGEIKPEDARLLVNTDTSAHFAVKQVFSDAVGHLVSGQPMEALGEPAIAPAVEKIGLRPVINRDQIRGTVIHIDHFENVVLNIDQQMFAEASKGRSFSLFFKRNDPITTLSSNYGDVPVGETLCLFNSAGLLEIAVNFGKAATLLGLKKEDVVEVVFLSV